MRLVWLIGGWVALVLGAIGVVLPVLPTVPFLLVAVWCFARSSPALRERILAHPVYGPPIRAWMDRGEIPRRAKLWAVGAMTGGVMLGLWLGLPGRLVAVQAAASLAVGIFLVTRPEPR